MLLWQTWADEWALQEKVSFNGTTKRIKVNDGVTLLDIREEVYSAWIRWAAREDNARYLRAMRYSGGDPIPGGETGVTFFLSNGWKLEYDPNVVAVAGVLYSDNYPTAFWSASDQPLFPATVAALVNSAVTTQNVVTGDLAAVPASVWAYVARTLTSNPGPSQAQVAAAVRTELAAELARILELAKIHGLVAGQPLQVSQAQRQAGDIVQTISEAGGTVTVARAP